MSIINFPYELRCEYLKHLPVENLGAYSLVSKEALQDVNSLCQSRLQNLDPSKYEWSPANARLYYFAIEKIAQNVLKVEANHLTAFTECSTEKQLEAIIKGGQFFLLNLIKEDKLLDKALSKAIQLENLAAVKYVVEDMGANIDKLLPEDMSPLEGALCLKNRDIFEYFWNRGANRDSLLNTATPFGLASQINFLPLARWLLEQGHQLDRQEASMVAEAIRSGNYEAFDLYRDRGFDLEQILSYLSESEVNALVEHTVPLQNQLLKGVGITILLTACIYLIS